ncbi:ESPR-type extended signal peptide-containing protein [Taylorella equigenitalis]|uniref:ESPR-type extended signal peptide-containing protein n=1 Tax=Taylorella equigenitalis TaxID=29575 RepID=UPI00237D1A4B|nr:ESPR-type extended signal peptide-containing protein [Taylorella equigenitalis]WDU55170.1 YadA-like family protein [Taylorella equigenitalis]
MNTIFKTIYNEVLGAWVAVSEITKTGGKKSKNKMLSTAIIVTIAGGASVSFAQTTVPDNKNNVVDGGKSVAVGEENKVYGGASLGFGTQNLIGFTDAKAGNALVAGFRNISTANYSTAIGSNNMSTSVDSLAFGKGNFTGDFTKFSAIRTKAGTGANQPGNGGTWNALETKLNETVAKYNLTAISAANLKEMQAIGVQNLAINLGALAFGNRNISAGQRSIAIGNESVALKNNSTALGYKNLVNGIVANAFGAQNTVEAHNGLAVGVGNKVTGLYGISIGNASVTGADLTTLQNISTVSGVHSISLGNSNAVKGQYALVVGKSSRAYLDNSIAIGSKSISKGLNSTAIGSTAQAMNASSLAVGHNAISLGDKSVSIGNAQSLEKSTTAIGSNAKAWVFHSTAIGNTSEARGESSLAVGQNNKSYVAHSFSAGDWNSIKGRYAGSFGYHNNINNHGSYSYGNENTIDSNLSMAIGSSNNINSSADRTFILGRGINATHQNSVILGNKSESKAATAISSAKISGLSVTSFAGVGNAEYGVVSVGSNIKKEYFKDDLFTKNGNDPALKKRNSPEYIEYLAKIAFKKQELIKARLTDNPDADISDITDDYAIAKIKEGDANFKEPEWTPKLNQDQLNAAHKLGPRQIVNVAAGAVNENSTDAINGSQLFQVAKAIIDNGIKVQGDAGNAKTVKIGETVRIEGNASWADTDQGNNIATNTTGTGIMIGLKKALTGMTSGDFGGTVINADGVKVADNIKLADAGLTVGSVVIQPNKATVSGLQNPTANDEAVNLGYLTTKLTDLTNGGIKFTGNDGGDHILALGQKITIKGTANYADTDGGANIATQASDGQLLIGLKKALTGLTSVAIENGPTLSNAGIDAGVKKISNLKPADENSADNDAANVKFVKDAVKGLTDSGYTLKGDADATQLFKVGSTIAFTGDANITSTVSANGISLALKPDLTGLTSGTFGDTVINGDGVKVVDNIKLADAGLIVGSVVIQPNKATVSGLQNPTANDEAVNLGYLTTKLTDLTNGGIKFTGNDGGDHTLKLGQKITIKGTANYADTDGGANIATQASDGQLLIGLKKALTGLTSVAIENGPTLSNAGIDAGGMPISNLKPATDTSGPNDAANVQYVKDKVDALKNEGYTLTGDSGTTGVKPIGSSIAFTGDANISTAASGTGVAIALKPNLTGLTSGTFGDTVINGDGVKVADNIKLADDGLTAGNVRIDPASNKITGLEAPTDDKDAVNKKFLDDAVKGLADGGIKFTGNDGGDHTLKLGQKITIKGTANYADTDGGANIATQASDGQLLIGLKKALTGLTSFTTEGGTVLDDTGLAVKDGPSVKKDGIDAGGKKISNLKPADENSADNDAANVKFVKDAVKGLTDSGYTLKGDADATQLFKVGSTIAFTGDANITSTVSANGISLALKPDLTGLTSGTFGDTVINGDGVKVADNIKLADDGLTAGNVRIDPTSNKITGLEAPTDDKDAVNKKFLDDAVKGLTDGGIKFTGNDGGDHTLALGQKITIKGTANYADTDGGANIATQASDGQLLIGLKKALTGLTSVAIENGPTLSNAGIDAGGKPISNLKPATDTSGPNDAANVQYVKDKVDALKNEGYTLTGDSGTTGVKPIGSSIAFTGDENLTTTASNTGVAIALNKSLQNMQSVAIANGPILNADGLKINDKVKLGSDGLTAGNVRIDPTSNKISGIEAPTDDKDAANKKYVDDHITNLNNNPLTFETNDGSTPKKLGDTLKIKGSDSNATKDNFDLSNIMTWIDENGVLRIGIRKSLELSSIKASDGAGKSATLNPDSLVFAGVDGKNGADGTVTMKVTTTGPADVKGNTLNRLSLNDVSIATLNDGFKYAGNVGGPISVTLNQTINIQGATANTNAKLFDGGKNVMTEVAQDGDGVKYTVAIKKSPEFENVTLTGTPAEGSTVAKPGKLAIQDGANKDKIIATVDGKGNSEIALKGASDKDIVKIGADSDSNGKVSVIGKDGANSTDLKHYGLAIKDASGTSNLGTNAQGTGGVEDLVANASAKKRRLTHTVDGKTEEIATLNDGLIVKGNTTDKAGVKLNNAVKVAGADSNTKWEDFDGGENIMTKVETKSSGETVIRVALRKDLKLKNGVFGGSGADGELKLKDKDGKDGLTLNSDKILFNNIEKLDENGRPQKNGSAGISMTQNGKPNLVEKGPATRIQITDGKGTPTAEVATMKDGLKFGSNSGDEASNLLNSKVNIIGQKSNNDWTKFDQGKNIMTNIEQKNGDTDITIALKRDVELDSATFGHGPAQTEENTSQEGKDGRIKLVNKNGKTTIQFDAGSTENQNSPAISISKSDSEDGTKLTSEGIEITKGPSDRATSKTTKAFVSIAPEGTAGIEQDQSQTRPRLTLRSGEGESAITEEIATMNDGLRFKGDSEELINKPLSSTLSIVGGETDSTKLTSVDTDKNIGVIVKDVANSGSRAPKDKVMQVRLAKKLKGLQSAEFKPVDDKGNPTGQTITVDSDGVSVAKEGKKSQFNEEGLKIGEDGPSVTDKGINAGGMSIANVGNPMKPHHASTKGYVDTEVKHLKNKINERYKDALGASAMAMASSGLMPPSPGKSAFAVASAVVAGQPAFAMGLTTMTENGKLMFKGAVASDARGQVGGLVGAAYQW